METQQNQPPVTVVVQQPKRSTLGRKVMGLFIGAVIVIAVISMIGANANTKFTPTTSPASPAATSSGPIDLGGEKPIDAATAAWVSGDAMDDVQQIVDLSEKGAAAANSGDLEATFANCKALGEAGFDLAEGAPQNAVGDAARDVAGAFGLAAAACEDGDLDLAASSLGVGSDAMTRLTAELKRYTP